VCSYVLKNIQGVWKLFHFSSGIYTIFETIFSELSFFCPHQMPMILCVKLTIEFWWMFWWWLEVGQFKSYCYLQSSTLIIILKIPSFLVQLLHKLSIHASDGPQKLLKVSALICMQFHFNWITFNDVLLSLQAKELYHCILYYSL